MKADEFGYEDPQYDYQDLVNRNLIDLGSTSDSGQQAAPPPSAGPDQYQGFQSTWEPGASAPSNAPAGAHWDENLAMYQPDAAQQAPPPPAPPTQGPTPGPGPGTQTQNTPTSYTPPAPSQGVPSAGSPPTAASSIPPDLINILNSLKEGISNFKIPPINIQPQTTPAYDDLVRSAIMDAIRQGQQPVNASDPLVAPLLAAVQGQSQRAKESNQANLSERLAAKHLLSSGAYDVGTERYNQGIDEATGGTIAQLMTNVLSQRQQKLMQAIQMGSNYLNADQARQLQAELANVNSALQQYQAKSSVGLGTLASLLQNQQFYDSLGANIGMFQQNQNNLAGTF